MIDDSILDEVIPVPDPDAKMAEMKESLEENGFKVTKWGTGAVFYWLTRICVQIHIELLKLARVILNNMFIRHAEGKWLELKAAEFSKSRKAAIKTQGYITINRNNSDTALTITKAHIFKTKPDASGTELKYYAVADTLIPAGIKTGKVLVEAEKAGTQYNVSENQITVSMIYLEGIENITNDQDWIYLEGADEESYSSLRTRTLGSWEELSVNTTAGKLKSVVESLPGVMCAYVDDQHPRGQGTVDVIVIGTAGAASAELIQQAQQAIDTLRDNYEDYLVKPGEIVYQDVDITLHLRAGTSTTDVADVAKTLISSAMRLSNRSDFNLFLQDDIRYVLKSNIPGYRKTVFTSPATDVELAQDKVIMLSNITVQVVNT